MPANSYATLRTLIREDFPRTHELRCPGASGSEFLRCLRASDKPRFRSANRSVLGMGCERSFVPASVLTSAPTLPLRQPRTDQYSHGHSFAGPTLCGRNGLAQELGDGRPNFQRLSILLLAPESALFSCLCKGAERKGVVSWDSL